MITPTTRALSLTLGLALAAPAALAAGGGEQWLTLDREIEALSQTLQPATDGGLSTGVLLRFNYAYFEESPTGPASDYSGFVFDNIRPWVQGQIGNASVYVSVEAQSGTMIVLDAWAAMNVTEKVSFSMGQIQPAVLRSALVEPQNLLFILRSAPGAYWQARVPGASVSAQLDRVLLRAALLNGADGTGNDQAWVVRADWNATGGSVALIEGAYGSGRQTALTVGASYYDDQNATQDGNVVTADAMLTTDRFSVAGEFQTYGNDVVVNSIFADTSPWAATLSYMVDPEKYEIGVRYEELDNVNSANAWTLGVNRYIAGHDLMWQLNFATVDSDLATQDGIAVGLGITVNV